MHLMILADTEHDALVHLANNPFEDVTAVTVCTHEGAVRGMSADAFTATEQIQTKARYDAMLAAAEIATPNALQQVFN